MARAGAEVTEFDFTVAGVTSISMDFHKYALCAKGSSIVLYRDAALRRHQFFAYGDWPGYVVVNATIQSSKSGGPLASTWATLRHFGRDGYLAIAEELRAATARAVELVEGIDGLRIVGAPEICLLAVGADSDPDGGGGNGGDGLPVDVFAVADVMEAKGWHMYPQLGHGAFGPSLHVTMLPWSTARIDEWGRDLAEAVAQVRARPATTGGGLADLVADVDLGTLSDEDIEGLMAMAGIGAESLGGEMAEVNHLLDALPPEVTSRLLRVFLDQLTRPDPND